ncbi:hypothetical protein QTP88_007409 [Uroleucon formosanum]
MILFIYYPPQTTTYFFAIQEGYSLNIISNILVLLPILFHLLYFILKCWDFNNYSIRILSIKIASSLQFFIIGHILIGPICLIVCTELIR